MKTFQTLGVKTMAHRSHLLLCLIWLILLKPLNAQEGGNELCVVGAQATISCDKVTVNFSGNPTWPTHHWDFGDGNVISGGPDLTNVSHDYVDINPYSIPLPTAGHSLNGVDWCYKELQEFLPGIFIGAGFGSNRKVSDLLLTSILPPDELVGRDIYVFGNLEIDAPYIFNQCNIYMRSGGKIVVKSGGALTLKNNTVADVHFISGNMDCQSLWNGIEVFPGGSLTTNGASIRNAYYAVSLVNPGNIGPLPKLSLQSTTFQRDFVGICASAGQFAISLFRNNTFEGSGNTAIYPLGSCEPPAQINGVPYAQRTYCGIYFDGSLGGSLLFGGSSFNNLFKDLQAGIVCINGTSSLQGCRFESITYLPNAPAAHQGTAVTFLDDLGGRILRLTGLGKNGAETVSNCERGVYARSSKPATQAFISDCRMLEVQNGVELDGALAGNFLKIKVSDCHIACTKYAPNIKKRSTGIEVKDPSISYTNVTINDNDIGLDQSEAYIITPGNPHPSVAFDEEIFPKGIALYAMHNQLSLMDVNIYGNNVNLIKGHYGISCENIINAIITDNHVVNSLDGLLSESLVGFYIEGGASNLLTCNTVSQVSASSTASIVGFVVSGSYTTTLTQNSTLDVLVGTTFAFDNGTSCSVSYNDFQIIAPAALMKFGLFYQNTITGPQYLQGNDWVGDFESGAVFFIDTSSYSYCDSRYHVSLQANVANAINPVVQGFPQDCITGSDTWFTVLETQEDDYSCGGTTGGTTVISKNEADLNLAGGGTSNLSPGYKWSSEMGLYRKFTDNPELIGGDVTINGFLQTHQGLPTAAMYGVENGVRGLEGSIPTNLGANIQSTLAQIESNEATLLALLEDIETDPNALASYTTMASQTKVLEVALEGYLTDALEYMAQSAAAVLTTTNTVNCTGLPCASERYIVGLYLETQLLAPRALTSSELQAVHAIGLYCPKDAGNIVYMARAWHYLQTGEGIYASCGDFVLPGAGERDTPSLVSDKEDGLRLIPNPADGSVQITLSTDLMEGTLNICDVWGRTLLQHKVSEAGGNVLTISTEGLPNGIYLVSVKGKSGRAFSQKLSITH